MAPGAACLALALGACAPTEPAGLVQAESPEAARLSLSPETEPVDPALYAARPDGAWTIPAIDVGRFPPGLLRHTVPYAGAEAPGTIVIDTKGPFLYYVEPGGQAIRYGIAIGREGFGWTGEGRIARTARWPGWTPPPEMIARDPSLRPWAGGMPGGPRNPLGARALYIYFGGADSGFRIHGTNQPGSIGWAASSGCFRMLNQDVIDLYDRVRLGAPVRVI
ncbi:L,D-transpeptidase [Amaricoccus solimangrovi]|uniref:L,D-transpeptidase n=2 Tax=Amaricoccus solimangrovi TaxID=2589815 RepID=A0A501WZ22_9RHOB|nr:L,D-transpeptidase [Amaricoccus solimangrovi]